MKTRILPLVLAVGHRGFTAGSNLLLIVVAGREMAVLDFGTLTLMLAVIGLILIPHASAFSEPMLVYGPKEYKGRLRAYVGFLSRRQLWFTMSCGALVALLGLVFVGWFEALLFALTIPLVLGLDFQDRSFFMQLKPIIPLISAIGQFASILGMVFLTSLAKDPQLADFLIIYFISFLLPNLFQYVMHMSILGINAANEIDTAHAWMLHKAFATWSVISHAMLFLVTNFYIFVLPIVQNIEVTANFRAQSAIIGPGVQAFSALGMVAVPLLRVVSGESAVFRKRLMAFLAIIGGLGLALMLTMGLTGPYIIETVYLGRYTMSPLGYWLAGAYPLCIGMAFMLGSALRALDRAQLVARSAIMAVALALLPGVWLCARYGTEGALAAQVLGTSIMGATAAYLLARCTSNEAMT